MKKPIELPNLAGPMPQHFIPAEMRRTAIHYEKRLDEKYPHTQIKLRTLGDVEAFHYCSFGEN